MKNLCRYIIIVWMLGCGFAYSQNNYCIQNRFGEAIYFDTSEVTVASGVVYGRAHNYFSNQDEDLKMDVYYPKASADILPRRPLILFIHGGGFLAGDKGEVAYKCAQWSQRGYVAATINYRVGWNCLNGAFAALCSCPDGIGMKKAVYEAVQDAHASLRYLHAHAGDYKIDTSAFFIGGESAGSITAMLTAYMSQAEMDSFNYPVFHQQLGVLDSSGNALPDGYSLKGIINSCGAVTDTLIIDSNEALPTIGFHDQNDCVVPFVKGYVINCTGNCYNYFSVTGSSLIDRRLSHLNVCSKLYEVAASGNHCSFPQDQLVKKASCFVKNILCNSCSSGFSTHPYDTVECSADIILNTTNKSRAPDIEQCRVFPNPTDGSATLIFTIDQQQEISITIEDVLGRLLMSRREYYQPGRQRITIDEKYLTPGISFFVLRSKEGMYLGKIIRQ